VPEESDWARGTDLSFLSAVIRSWRHEYDWRVHESRIQALPWESAGEGGRELRFVHQKSVVADVPVVVLLHGWPDSVLRFERVLPLLADLNVVVPALPGFPFAPQLTAAGMDTQKIAALIADTMDSLGYDRYVVSGGDIGGDVAEHLAAQRPSQVSALHLTNISPLHAVFADRSALSGDDLDYLDRVAAWQRAEGGYIAEQSSKPNTLAVGLADSPAGLAAWIVEKLRGWSDNDGDVESVFAREDLLTWISAYWHTGTIGTSFGTYADSAPPVPFVETPTVVSSFAHDTKPARRAFAERFVNVQRWLEHDVGGHFAAWEQPALYVRDLRQAVTLGERSAPHR
jgi:pimeloyl-ACP methyl ester carboxylesterase